ncbi:DUF3048 domain-containing protein [Paenibacillus sp. FSL W8-0919]|uniref:DUF3048 domain-containing protein n=1 Tax=Paenibacillus sp. FSL W8-0919 TaxID=2954707 RepID=UPI004046B145
MRSKHRLGKFAWRTSSMAIAAVLALSACGGKPQAEPVESPEVQSPVQPPVEDVKEPAAPAPYRAPLTGLAVEAPVTQRPLAVMINNAPAARPQSGLSQADIVYEVLAEGGITRLIGIFQSEEGIEQIGPIRSIRPYLIRLGESYGGVLVHAGGSPEAYSIIQKQGKQDLDEIGNAGAFFWRSKDRKAPHNLYSSDEKLRQAAAKMGYDQQVQVPQYSFLTEEPAGGTSGTNGTEGTNSTDDTPSSGGTADGTEGSTQQDGTTNSGKPSADAAENTSNAEQSSASANSAGGAGQSANAGNAGSEAGSQTEAAGEAAGKVDITFLLNSYVVSYEYDEATSTYKRSINGSPHVDLNNNEQLEAANVIVLGADHKVLDDIGRLAVDVETGGEAMLFQRGEVIRGQWVRAANDAIRFVKDGAEVALVPGTTYFNIVPNSPSFESHVSITNP